MKDFLDCSNNELNKIVEGCNTLEQLAIRIQRYDGNDEDVIELKQWFDSKLNNWVLAQQA